MTTRRDHYLQVIEKWLLFWMNQRQNSKEDFYNYFRRAIGVDANMRHHLAELLAEASDAHSRDVEGLKGTLRWLRDGIEHFNNEEDQGQVRYLTDAIDEALKKIEGVSDD